MPMPYFKTRVTRDLTNAATEDTMAVIATHFMRCLSSSESLRGRQGSLSFDTPYNLQRNCGARINWARNRLAS